MDKESLDNFKSLMEQRRKSLKEAPNPRLFAIKALKKSGYLSVSGEVAEQFDDGFGDITPIEEKRSELVSVKNFVSFRPDLRLGALERFKQQRSGKSPAPGTVFRNDSTKPPTETVKRHSRVGRFGEYRKTWHTVNAEELRKTITAKRRKNP